jgi:hypothetical protein
MGRKEKVKRKREKGRRGVGKEEVPKLQQN